MQSGDIRLKRKVAAVIRTMLMVALFTAVLLLAKVPAHADTGAALTVQKDGETLKEFSLEDLQQIAADEGNLSYDYSAWNTYPSFSEYKDVHGPTVTGVLLASGIDPEDIQETWTLTFTDQETGGYKAALTGKQLFEDRYYYPNGRQIDPDDGIVTDAAYSDAVKVPAIVTTESENPKSNRVFVGQAAPNEENNPLFVKDLSAHGYIMISTDPAPVCKPVTADPENLTTWRAGKEITLSSANNYEYDKIYYTIEAVDDTSSDASADPGYGCTIYNWGPKQDIELKPVLPSGKAKARLKVIVKGYGKQDSKVQKFTYNIGEPLTVRLNGETVKTYDRDELNAFAGIEAGSEGLDYSGYNSYPTLQYTHIDDGYRVDSIIKDATGKDVSGFNSSSTVRFTGSDGYSSVFTMGQLFGSERFYYPDAAKGTDSNGGKALPEAYSGKKPVPAVIDSSRESKLLFGQIAPNEQNHSEFVSYMLQGGVIEINDSPAEKCDPASAPDPAGGSVLEKGQQIKFPIPSQNKNKRDKLYYIADPADGEEPGSGCAFYYYAPYHWPEEMINPPAFDTAGHHRLAARITAYGKQDSDVKVFDYYVRPDAPAGLNGSEVSDDSIELSWEAQEGASGYRIYRTEAGGTLAAYKDIGPEKTSFSDTEVAAGTTYEYAVSALAEGKDGALESDRSGSISVTLIDHNVPPETPAGFGGTVISYNSVKLTWDAQAGVSGYRLYRAVSGGNLTAYRDTGPEQTEFTDKGLAAGKTYMYAVTALAEGREGTLESTASESIALKPVPGKPTVKLTAGKKKIKVKWNRISGASGYVIMRSTKKSSGYKKIRTVTKGSTISFTNTKLKKGKKYYYKVRAYRKVSGKKIYGKYSEVKYSKAK